ncbi:Peroxidasin -like protein [Caligus rogercresseyi]|uniref:Peroxidasin -like protein n=1 Tax=Caligus rogercresseyi TaxID=217165 RepID=A0A7T8GV19_CALRO|nr:Peroxidasin -like protein [Caligus rogercresseyi]
MHWTAFVFLSNVLATYALLTPRHAVELAEQELLDFPETPELCSKTKRYKKVTQSSLKMSKRNAMIQKALSKLESSEEALINEFRDTTTCSATVTCSTDSKYRTIDGTCNNQANPIWGSTGAPLARVLSSQYGNTDYTPKTVGTYSTELPNARLVSNTFHPDSDVPSTLATHLLTQMGQFLDHDLSLTPEAHIEHCCDDSSQDGCMVISIPSTDSFYSQFSQTCIELTRSVQYCDSSPREQFNVITSYIDASNVYGSDQRVLDLVRESNGYLLSVTTTSTGKELLPQRSGTYYAGDVRAIEMPGLATMHTLFVREHNRIAKEMIAAYPALDSETVFQETRRIVGADLAITEKSEYNSGINADISNAFATAAYRFGHSMIQGEIARIALSTSGSNSSYTLKDVFFNLANYEGTDGSGMEEILYGLINQASQKNDRLVIDDVTNHLFNNGAAFGSDLIARNIARGRDHGLPTYGYWRKHCKFSELCNWDSRPDTISQANWDILKGLYTSPNDIDLFTAGLAETPQGNSVVGPTFSCIIGSQFSNTKFGDRYFFTHKGQTGSFTTAQITNIKTRTLGQIICDNTDIPMVRANVFRMSSKFISCPRRSTLDIKLFDISNP